MKKHFNLKSSLKNLFRIDSIRASKLLEIGQFTILAFILGFISGSILNDYAPVFQFDDDPKQSTSELLSDVLTNVFLISICLYYSHKILDIIRHEVPFLFSLDKRYVPCMKNECIVGITLGFSLSFLSSMTDFRDKVKKLHEKLFHPGKKPDH